MLRREQPNRWQAWGLAALILLLSHMVISHQLDSDVTHHTEHQCSLFNACNHALITDVANIDLPIYQSILSSSPRFHAAVIEIIQFNARSPPY
ncbi:MAG: DUF2607 family protein [Aliivibrio sp.]|uniref:DUF2607 family protein n=1 Tax=Aliivibrio sp. TaxID=1872443 RepID=UPI001A5EAF62|nr:DUF2607 family protein [Aliivibrio sp.]